MPTPPHSTHDPLANPAFKGPSFMDCLRDILGATPPKQLDCMQVEVTSRCTGRCTYCPHTTHKDHWRSSTMEASTFAALWPLMQTTHRVHLQGWGEPLLHPRFFDFAALARKAGCQVSTTSCGLHMDADIATKIVTSGMDIIAFSLAGTDPVSNAPRAGVPFDRVCTAITTLQAERKKRMGVHLEIHLAYLMLAQSMDAVRALPRLMRELGVHAAVVSTLDYIGDDAQQEWAFAPHETEKIAHARALLAEATAEATANGDRLFYSLPQPLANAQCRENIQRNMYIDAEGRCAPCIYLNLPTTQPNPLDRTFGSVAECPVLDIWNAPDFARFRNSLEEQRPEGACKICPKRYEELL